ncbi:hypothetical protein ACFYVL_32575 [Streptomyces sp. NPDC004111]|uniref:hypothetical protein n=1 Tax=Streptomyces sp. NPDC004111 TaxID=3364690 RepID=UPI0036B79319
MGSVGGPSDRHHCPVAPVYDTEWAEDVRHAVRCAVTLLVMLVVIDVAAESASWPRAALWLGLAGVLLVILVPVRVTAGPGWLATHGVLGAHVVRTDRLVSVRWADGVAQRMVLRDADGERAELDPRVLVANPALWRMLDEDARACVARGTLRCGKTALENLADRIDRETARTVFRVSGLE